MSGNLLLYYQKGNPRAAVAPDVFVVLGVSNADRSSYRLWEEPKGPDFVLEITSRTDVPRRPGTQARVVPFAGRAGVLAIRTRRADYLEPPLQGLELSAGEYRGLPERELADGTLALASGVLGLELRLTERGLRFHDPETGQDLPNLAETDDARQREQQARERERQARQAAEARLAQGAAARAAAGSTGGRAGGVVAPGAR